MSHTVTVSDLKCRDCGHDTYTMILLEMRVSGQSDVAALAYELSCVKCFEKYLITSQNILAGLPPEIRF